MKKVLSIILTVALVLAVGAAAYAETGTRGRSWTDADNDGVCDVCGAADADGDGVCDDCPNAGARPMDGTGRHAGHSGHGTGFIDTDNDGACDNFQGAGACGGRMNGRNK